MKTRNVEVSLTKAREWYKSGNKALKEVALQAFSKDELEVTDFKLITSLEDAINALGLSLSDELANIEKINTISVQAAAIYKLDLVRRALNGGEIPSMDSGEVYCPWVKIYNISKLPSNAEMKKYNWVLGSEFEHKGKFYVLINGGYCSSSAGVSHFCGGYGYVGAGAGLLYCKSMEIATHMSRHFGKLIFDAAYSQYDFIDWENHNID